MADEETAGLEDDALSLKAMAVEKYISGNPRSALNYAKRALGLQPSLEGLLEIIYALEILSAMSPMFHDDQDSYPDYYKILQVDRFSHINTIRKQFNKLALTLHPDKSSFSASGEAYKFLSEAMQVLSDKARRKEYDTKLMQSEPGTVETFSAACSSCQFLHHFDRKFLGHNLMCSKCNISFNVVEIKEQKNVAAAETRTSSRIRERIAKSSEDDAIFLKDLIPKKVAKSCVLDEDMNKNKGLITDRDKMVQRKRAKRMKSRDYECENMTLSQMHMLMKKGKKNVKLIEGNSIMKDDVEEDECSNQSKNTSEDHISDEKRKLCELERGEAEKELESVNMGDEVSPNTRLEAADISLTVRDKFENVIGKKRETSEKRELRSKRRVSEEVIDIGVDSKNSNFNREKCFRKGQVVAIYGEKDNVPRKYAVIDEVISMKPFEATLSLLQHQTNELTTCVGCGIFTVSHKVWIDNPDSISHVADYERAARNVYRIYPKKGSVWAVYKNEQCYSNFVVLSSYSDAYGVSLVEVEKINGFNTMLKRRNIGVKCFGKKDLQLFSHQIPAIKRKTFGLPPQDCWELDPIYMVRTL